jgi:GH24 family phage-related lysozyme (muramidase)
MHQSVIDIFPSFTANFEGRIPYMYQDVLGLITIGLGCLIDPIEMAMELAFLRKSDNKYATDNEIASEWHAIKDDKTLAKRGHLVAKKITTLYLSEQAIDSLASKRMSQFERDLKKGFQDWDNFPANAQLTIMSMAWAMGSLFYKEFPKFTKSCNLKHWLEASTECKIREAGNAGVVPRNAANKTLLENAEIYPGREDVIL